MEASEVFLALFSVVMTAVVGALGAAVKMHKERERKADAKFDAEHDLLLQGMRALMKSELSGCMRSMCRRASPCHSISKSKQTAFMRCTRDLAATALAPTYGKSLWMRTHPTNNKEN